MDVTLQGISGPGNGIEQRIGDGSSLSVGRTNRANLAIGQDNFLSGLHFAIENRDGRVMLRDLGSSNGTSRNGVPVQEVALADGDLIAAGQTIFRVTITGATPAQGLLEVLTAQPGYLFAVLDAARDPKIYPMILASQLPYYSLYRGQPELELAPVAPYLLYLPPDTPMLAHLLKEGWSKSWGIFLTCNQSMDEVRKQLRRSLMVTIEGSPTPVYFRFYDPRVLRVFLPIAEPQQLIEFGGGISSFFMEDEQPDTLLKFYPKGIAIGIERIAVAMPN